MKPTKVQLISFSVSLCEVDVISKYIGKPGRKAPQVLGKPSKEHHSCLVNLAKKAPQVLGKQSKRAPQVLGKPSKEHHRCLVNLAKSTTGAW